MTKAIEYALFVVICCTFSLSAEHSFYVKKDFTRCNFPSNKLGIAFYPQGPDLSEIEAKFSQISPRENYRSCSENAIRTFLKRNVGFLGIDFLNEPFPIKSFQGQIGRRTKYTFAIPEKIETFLPRYGVSYLMVIYDFQINAGSYDVQHYTDYQTDVDSEEYDRDRISDQRYPQEQYILSNSFWYILIDVLTGEPFQYGYVSNEFKMRKPTVENWMQSLQQCFSDIITDGAIAKCKN